MCTCTMYVYRGWIGRQGGATTRTNKRDECPAVSSQKEGTEVEVGETGRKLAGSWQEVDRKLTGSVWYMYYTCTCTVLHIARTWRDCTMM